MFDGVVLEGRLRLVVSVIAASILSASSSALSASASTSASALGASASAIAFPEGSMVSMSSAGRVALSVWIAILELGGREFLHNGVKLFAIRYSMRATAYLAGICLCIVTHDVERWLIADLTCAFVESCQVFSERIEVMMKVGGIRSVVFIHLCEERPEGDRMVNMLINVDSGDGARKIGH